MIIHNLTKFNQNRMLSSSLIVFTDNLTERLTDRQTDRQALRSEGDIITRVDLIRICLDKTLHNTLCGPLSNRIRMALNVGHRIVCFRDQCQGLKRLRVCTSGIVRCALFAGTLSEICAI